MGTSRPHSGLSAVGTAISSTAADECRRVYLVYWILLGFTGFYCVLLGFTGFYRALQGFTGFYWVLLGFTGFSWVILGYLLVLPSFLFFCFFLGFIG